MIKRPAFVNGKLALVLSPGGVDNIVFTSSDRKESLGFYLLIEEEIRKFEVNITLLAKKKGERENGIEK